VPASSFCKIARIGLAWLGACPASAQAQNAPLTLAYQQMRLSREHPPSSGARQPRRSACGGNGIVDEQLLKMAVGCLRSSRDPA